MAKKIDLHPSRRVSDLLVAKAKEHGTLSAADESTIRGIKVRTRKIRHGEDIVCQGERPSAAVFVLSGMLARYHTLPDGDRQYLSFHIKGDLPDIQSLFLRVMDHSLCALNDAEIALLPHAELCQLFLTQPGIGFAFWSLTLMDAAMFREAITSNGARNHVARVAHLFCQQYFRARQASLLERGACDLPLNQRQLGQALGMSHISVNRAIAKIRNQGLADFRGGKLVIANWQRLMRTAGFDPTYLKLAKLSDISHRRFRSRQ